MTENHYVMGAASNVLMTIDDKRLAALDAYFKQWQQIVHETLPKSLGPLIEAQRTCQKALEPILSEQKRWRDLIQFVKMPHFALSHLARLAKPTAEFQRSLQRLLSPFEQIQRSFRELPASTREALLILGSHGWYLDLEMPLTGLWELKKALSEGNVEEAEEALVNYFEDRLEEIEKSIGQRFPHRAHLIRAAFNAHRRQEYELSIPVLLAQSDGICKEVVDQYLFMKHGKKPRTAIYVDQIAAASFSAALLSPLAQTLPISASEHERSASFDDLNRHTVLHGESLDYGSKTNSLKAISLLNYVVHVLKSTKETPRQGDPGGGLKGRGGRVAGIQ